MHLVACARKVLIPVGLGVIKDVLSSGSHMTGTDELNRWLCSQHMGSDT